MKARPPTLTGWFSASFNSQKLSLKYVMVSDIKLQCAIFFALSVRTRRVLVATNHTHFCMLCDTAGPAFVEPLMCTRGQICVQRL